MIKLDYSLNTPEERLELVNKILENDPNPSKYYLEILADYLVFCMEKEEKKEKKILTENRMATVSKRETSFEGLVSQFENGEDGVYGIVNNNLNKHTIFQPKVSITQEDIEDIPELEQARNSISYWNSVLSKTKGKDAFIAKKALIESRKDQYVIKNAFKPPVIMRSPVRSTHWISLNSEEGIDDDGNVWYKGVSLLDPQVCSAILCNYSKLKQESWGNFDKDTWYIMESFDRLCAIAFEKEPILEKIIQCKIDGMQNQQIQEILKEEIGVRHSIEYISSLWRNKIPTMIASAAEDEFLSWYYLNIEKGKYKTCTRCGQIKLAHNKYFSKNKTSKDSFYSICKECRNKGGN